MPKPRRRLFLDDDPARAEAFLRDHPEATWVQTVPECVEKLAEPWDEVHLDHDLGGEVYVDVDRDDCGMEVVRWLAREPRRHLRRAQFTVHSHNMVAACLMTMQIRALGYEVEARPFGLEPPEPEPGPAPDPSRTWARDLVRRLRGKPPLAGPPSGDDGPLDGLP